MRGGCAMGLRFTGVTKAKKKPGEKKETQKVKSRGVKEQGIFRVHAKGPRGRIKE